MMTNAWLATIFALALALALVGSLPAAAMSTLTPPTSSSDYVDGEKAVKEGRYKDAVELLNKVVQREPENANAHNYLGYSLRKLGDLNKAEAHYRVALQIEPQHKAALEYYGELFLQMKDLPRAQEQLTKLKLACPSGCTERAELEKAMVAYKAGS
jgi:Flp pilus assembly protein TadD